MSQNRGFVLHLTEVLFVTLQKKSVLAGVNIDENYNLSVGYIITIHPNWNALQAQSCKITIKMKKKKKSYSMPVPGIEPGFSRYCFIATTTCTNLYTTPASTKPCLRNMPEIVSKFNHTRKIISRFTKYSSAHSRLSSSLRNHILHPAIAKWLRPL